MTSVPGLDEFVIYLRHELNRSRHTVEAYRRDILQFAVWLGSSESPEIDFPSVTTADIRAWLSELALAETSSSIRRKTQSLRAFFRWMVKSGEIHRNPAAGMLLAKKARPLPEFVDETEMEHLLEAKPENAPLTDHEIYLSARNHLIVNLLYSTGMRQAELLGLTDADIDVSAGEAKVTGKRDKQRIIPLPGPLIEEIRAWQDMRDRRHPDLPEPRPIITGADGALGKMQLYRVVRQALADTNSPVKSPHVLRHSFATAMLNDGANLDVVKEMLGHSSLATTEIYTHLSFEQLKKNYAGAHPRSGEKKNSDKG